MANIKTKIFPLTGMSCVSCAMSSQMILSQQEGVAEANVNFANSTAEIKYDANKISPEKLKQVLEQVGFNLIIESEANEKKN